jgi:hypothetical protein
MLASQEGLCSMQLDNYIVNVSVELPHRSAYFQLNLTFSSSLFITKIIIRNFSSILCIVII